MNCLKCFSFGAGAVCTGAIYQANRIWEKCSCSKWISCLSQSRWKECKQSMLGVRRGLHCAAGSPVICVDIVVLCNGYWSLRSLYHLLQVPMIQHRCSQQCSCGQFLRGPWCYGNCLGNLELLSLSTSRPQMIRVRRVPSFLMSMIISVVLSVSLVRSFTRLATSSL